MRIGVDVGGTNTDAVLMDGASVVATAQDADDGERELGNRRRRSSTCSRPAPARRIR